MTTVADSGNGYWGIGQNSPGHSVLKDRFKAVMDHGRLVADRRLFEEARHDLTVY